MSLSPSIRRTVAAWLLCIGAVLAAAPEANADFRFRFRGHVGGGIRVHAPRVRYYPRPILPWWPTFVVVNSYDQPRQADAPVAYGYGMGPRAVAPARPALSKYAVGGYVGKTAISNGDNAAATDGVDATLVVRARLADHWLLEGTLRQSQLDEADERLYYAGAGLVGELTPFATFSPYLVGALGKELDAQRTYVELGAGLRASVSPSLQLFAELRGGAIDGDLQAASAPNTGDHSPARSMSRAQLGAMVQF